jgi:hypothetical protein
MPQLISSSERLDFPCQSQDTRPMSYSTARSLPWTIFAPSAVWRTCTCKKTSTGRFFHMRRSVYSSATLLTTRGGASGTQRHERRLSPSSAVFCESVFPFRKPRLSAVDKSVDPSPPAKVSAPSPPTPEALAVPQPPNDLNDNEPLAPELADPAPLHTPHLVPCFESPPPTPPVNLPEQPCLSPEVRNLMTHFKHHLAGQQLPPKRASQACQPGALAEDAAHAESTDEVIVPILAAMDYTLVL